MKSLKIAAIFIVFFSLFSVNGQQGRRKQDKTREIEKEEKFESTERNLWGVIIDAKTKTPLEYATISVINKKTNGILKGIVTNTKGKFDISIDKEKKDYYLLIEFLGYKSKFIKTLDLTKDKINLGKILIQSEENQLEEVVIRAETSKTTFKLDKRVFNVGKDLTNSGASTMQILENVPSITVGMKGGISLRGNSNVKILINGNSSASKSSGKAALNGIAPDMIERIEVITNPSAKYDAAGTAGILNVILRKERKSGLNGTVSINGGSPKSYGLGVNLNYRTNKINLSGGISGEYNSFKATDNSVTKYKKASSLIKSRISNGNGINTSKELSANWGIDYNITKTDFLSAAASLGFSEGNNNSSYKYSTIRTSGTTNATRTETGENKSPNYELNVNYKKTLGGKDNHTLEARYSGFNYTEDNKAGFTNKGITNNKQLSNTKFTEGSNTAQIDYKYPFGTDEENAALEIGLKYRNRKLKNNYNVADFTGGNWVNNANFSNVFSFNENLWAGYITYGQEFGKFGVKAGLRTENTKLTTKLETTNKSDGQNYIDYFPSLHTSYKLTDDLSLQLSYSRRISRPDMFSLNPFESIRDQFSQFQGNPSLKPEYSNSYEFGMIKNLEKGSLFASVYTKTTSNTVEEFPSTGVNGIIITKPQNIGSRQDLGMEFNGSYRIADWYKVSSEFNWFYYSRTAPNISIKSNQWSASLSNTFKLPIKLDAELSFNYNSKQKQLFQTQNDNFYTNLGLKKILFKNRISLNLSIRDLFNSRKYSYTTNQVEFYRNQNARWGGRQINLGISIKLGKADVENGEMDDYGDDFH